LAALPTARAAKISQPNILVIMTDEHNASVLGCYGNKIIRTPNLDGLAAKGILFENAYCSSPLCVPSRSAFTSGKYISRTSSWNNNTRLPPDIASLPRVMNEAGYDSVLCGKMHYDARYHYGFKNIGPGNNAHMTGTGNRRTADDLTAKQGGGGESARFEDFRTSDNSSGMTHDQRVVDAVQAYLASRKQGDKPFFLLAGLISPHFPLVVPKSYWQTYQDKVPMPVIPPGYVDSLPLNYKHLRAGFQMTSVPPETVKFGRELYYGLTQWTDEQIGKILDALRKSGELDNTVIIYTTDHGENLGEHGLWWKNAVFDTAARVPLIISWPERWTGGQRRQGACGHLDVVQTIAQLGGAKIPADWNGCSLCAWMDNAHAPWKDLAVSEYYAHNICSGYAMIREGAFKYVYHTSPDEAHPPQRELYDLSVDPNELHNLADDPAQSPRIAQMHAALVKEIGEDPELTDKRCRKQIAAGYSDAAGKKRGKGKR